MGAFKALLVASAVALATTGVAKAADLLPPPPARSFGPGFGWEASICGVELSGVRYFLPNSIVCAPEMLAFGPDQVIL